MLKAWNRTLLLLSQGVRFGGIGTWGRGGGEEGGRNSVVLERIGDCGLHQLDYLPKIKFSVRADALFSSVNNIVKLKKVSNNKCFYIVFWKTFTEQFIMLFHHFTTDRTTISTFAHDFGTHKGKTVIFVVRGI